MIIGIKNSRNNSHCKLNLRMDGSDNGTSFVDSSPNTKTITATNAVTKTATKKFGTASGYFNGSNTYLSIPDSNDFHFDDADFTIEMWLKFTSTTDDYQNVFTKSSTSSPYQTYSLGYENRDSFASAPRYKRVHFLMGDTTAGTYIRLISLDDLADDTWHHVAITKQETDMKMYVDGILNDSITGYSSTSDNTELLYIGSNGTALHGYYNGYIDSLLFIKDDVTYKRNFQVPNRTA